MKTEAEIRTLFDALSRTEPSHPALPLLRWILNEPMSETTEPAKEAVDGDYWRKRMAEAGETIADLRERLERATRG